MTVLLGCPSPALLTAMTRYSHSLRRLLGREGNFALDGHTYIGSRAGGRSRRSIF